jgi:hypothetical protein
METLLLELSTERPCSLAAPNTSEQTLAIREKFRKAGWRKPESQTLDDQSHRKTHETISRLWK